MSGVSVERRGGVALVTLDAPPANALTPAVLDGLDAAVTACEAADVGAVLVRSAQRTFSAGADLVTVAAMLEAGDAAGFAAYLRQVNEVLDRLEALPKPVVCAVNGHAVGGGLELALACDLRYGADAHGIRIGLPEASLGLIPAGGGVRRLARLVGPARAFDLLVPGRTIAPRAALAVGLLHGLFDPARLGGESLDHALRLAEGPTAAYAAVKRCLRGEVREVEAMLELFGSADAREGVSAFLEKRKPRFRGGAA